MTDDVAVCDTCGNRPDPTGFECSYCGRRFCAEHRLPERHDCTQLSLASPPDGINESPEEWWRTEHGEVPYETIDPKTLGTPPEDFGDPSPDVALDGSIASEATDDSTETGDAGFLSRLLTRLNPFNSDGDTDR